jgi:hypothetical protein
MNTVRYSRARPWLWLIPATVGGAITLLLMAVVPPDRTLHSLADYVVKVTPLVCAVMATAAFPRRGAWMPGLVALGFVFYMGYVDSAFFIQVSHLIDAAVARHGGAQFAAYYRFSLFVDAFVVLFALFAFRLGGGSAAWVLKLGAAGILVLTSGLNDLTMWLMYPWPQGQRPATFDWASHVTVFIGHTPRVGEMAGFLAVHLLLIAVILSLPVQRWLDRAAAAGARLGSRPQAPARAGRPSSGLARGDR